MARFPLSFSYPTRNPITGEFHYVFFLHYIPEPTDRPGLAFQLTHCDVERLLPGTLTIYTTPLLPHDPPKGLYHAPKIPVGNWTLVWPPWLCQNELWMQIHIIVTPEFSTYSDSFIALSAVLTPQGSFCLRSAPRPSLRSLNFSTLRFPCQNDLFFLGVLFVVDALRQKVLPYDWSPLLFLFLLTGLFARIYSDLRRTPRLLPIARLILPLIFAIPFVFELEFSFMYLNHLLGLFLLSCVRLALQLEEANHA